MQELIHRTLVNNSESYRTSKSSGGSKVRVELQTLGILEMAMVCRVG